MLPRGHAGEMFWEDVHGCSPRRELCYSSLSAMPGFEVVKKVEHPQEQVRTCSKVHLNS